MEQYKTKEWSKLLPLIQYTLNTSKPSSTKYMPFEIFFNKEPNVGSKKEFLVVNEKGLEEPLRGVDTYVADVAVSPVSTAQVEENAIQDGDEANNDEDDEGDDEGGDDMANARIEIEKKRSKLNENKDKNANMMIRKHDHKRNKKTREFCVKDVVTVKIPLKRKMFNNIYIAKVRHIVSFF